MSTKVPAHIFRLIKSSFHQVHQADLVRSLVSFLAWLRIRHLSCLISSVRWSLFTLVADLTFVLFDLIRSLVFFFFTLVVDSTFVLFDLVRWLVSLSFTTGKFWGYGQYTKIWSALKFFLSPCPHPATIPQPTRVESNSVHAYILQAGSIIVFSGLPVNILLLPRHTFDVLLFMLQIQ